MNAMTHPRSVRLARALLTAITVVLCFGPIARDSNSSHLTHPEWPGHARLHFMWALGFMACSGAVLLHLLWRRPPTREDLRLCCAWLAADLLGGFWAAVALADAYGGVVRDPAHHATILGVNENVLVFGTLTVLLAAAWGLTRRA